MTTIKSGDVLEVRVLAYNRLSDRPRARLENDLFDLEILSHTPAPEPLKVGDRVRHKERPMYEGEITAIGRKAALVMWELCLDGPQEDATAFSNLERIP